MVGIRSSPWSQLPSSPDCDLCYMQQLCTCAAGAGGGGGECRGEWVCPGPGLPSFHHQLPTNLLPLNAPCSCSNFVFCYTSALALSKSKESKKSLTLWISKPPSERGQTTFSQVCTVHDPKLTKATQSAINKDCNQCTKQCITDFVCSACTVQICLYVFFQNNLGKCIKKVYWAVNLNLISNAASVIILSLHYNINWIQYSPSAA